MIEEKDTPLDFENIQVQIKYETSGSFKQVNLLQEYSEICSHYCEIMDLDEDELDEWLQHIDLDTGMLDQQKLERCALEFILLDKSYEVMSFTITNSQGMIFNLSENDIVNLYDLQI